MLLALYLLLACADAAGKWLASNPAVNDAMRRLVGGHASSVTELREAARPSGNFEIFRTASHHLRSGEDLYARYPELHSDQFKYSPTFAFLFSPFAWIPWPLALFLWSAMNAMVLFVAVERLLPPRQAMLALALLLLEVMRAMQNAQSNALMAALIVLTFVALERGRGWRAAAAVGLGACVKIFPLAALTFAVPRRLALRTGLATVAVGALLITLPLIMTSPGELAAQYRSWQAIEASETVERWFSAMELTHRLSGANLPNWIVQLTGVIVLLLPLGIRRDRWEEPHFRLLYLCSVLLFSVLFNHQAERAAYIIGFVGATIWFVTEPRATWRTTLYGVVLVTIPIMSTLVPGAWLRTPTMMTYRLALPSLAIWLVIQWALWRRSVPSATPVADSHERRVELDLHVALERR